MSDLRKDLLNPTLAEVFEIFKMDKNYTSSDGAYLIDENGVRYLDFIAQYGAVPFGYNSSVVWDALEDVRRRALPSLVQPSLPGETLKLANILAELSPGDLAYCNFCQSGTEAVEAAIKLSRSTTGKDIIVSTVNSFHGKTLGSLSATGKDSYQKPFCAPAPGFLRIPYNDLDVLKATFEENADNIAAFIVEPVQGEGGIIVAEPGYLKAAQELCNEYNVIFIVDEIQTGLGRTGRLFACEYEDVNPDIMLLAKALGGGIIPLGVCISSPRIWNEDFAMLHSSTFANNQVSSAVGIAVMKKLCENQQALVKDVNKKGDYLLEKTRRLADKYPDVIKEVRGKGLMVGLEFQDLSDCGSFDMSFLTDQGGFTILLTGFLLNVCNIRLAPYLNDSMTLRLEPTLTINYEEIDYVVDALNLVCNILDKRDYALLYRYLLGNSSKPEEIRDYRSQSRVTKYSDQNETESPDKKFAFIIHYPGPEDVILNNPSFDKFSREELYDFLNWQSRTGDPGIVCHMPAIKGRSGSIAEGWLIGVPYGAREIMNMPREEVVETIGKAVDMGRDAGAEIVGLGALTSVVTRGGRSVTGRGTGITSGNSYTTLMAVEALFMGAEKMHVDPIAARGGVVGATGSIGRACALMVSEKLCQLTLFGNPQHSTSSKNRLNSLGKEIFSYAYERLQEGKIEGMAAWLDRVIKLLYRRDDDKAREYLDCIKNKDELSLQFIGEICAYLDIECPVSTSINIDEDLADCSMVIATSNSPEYLIHPADISPGAVVCDVARPADVSPEVYEQREDVLILEGGLVQYPDDICFGPNLGYRDGVNLACLSETILLALEGDYEDHSIGSKLSLDTVHYLRGLQEKHGFQLAGLKMGNHEIRDEEIDEIYRRSLDYREAANS